MKKTEWTQAAELSIGGPKLWMGLAAGIGAGLCSIPVGEWVFSVAGRSVSPGAGAEADAALYLFLILGTGDWFAGTWLLVRPSYRLDPAFRRCSDAMACAYAGSALIYVFRAISATMSQHAGESLPSFTQLASSVVCFVLVYLLSSAFFSARQPRNGLFFAGLCALSVLEASDYQSVFASGYARYLTGVRMAFVFAYVYGGPSSQRIVALLISACFIALTALDAYAKVDFDVGAVVAFIVAYVPSLVGSGAGALVWRRRARAGRRVVPADRSQVAHAGETQLKASARESENA